MLLAVAVLTIGLGAARVAGAVRSAATSPLRAAPYEYLGWGNPPAPASVLAATGIKDLTLAFIDSHGTCDPEWDGQRPLLGGADAAAIASIRRAGGDIVVSFGGWSGSKLGTSCTSVAALKGAYERVIDDYSLTAIDVDIEHTEYTSDAARSRVVRALAETQHDLPALQISVTFDTDETGPDPDGVAMIHQAAALGFQPAAWTIMPFDFGTRVRHMGTVSTRAAEGLDAVVAAAYHESAATAYAHIGISSMNGDTDEADETVSIADFRQIVAFARAHSLARLTFWAVDRDRPCGHGRTLSAGSCSGVAQAPFAFTRLLATDVKA